MNGLQHQLDPWRFLNSSEMSLVGYFSNFLQRIIQILINTSSNSFSYHFVHCQQKTLFPTSERKLRGFWEETFSMCIFSPSIRTSSHILDFLFFYLYKGSLSKCLHPLPHIDYSLPSSLHRQICFSFLTFHSFISSAVWFWFYHLNETVLLTAILFGLLCSTWPDGHSPPLLGFQVITLFCFSFFHSGHSSVLSTWSLKGWNLSSLFSSYIFPQLNISS